MGSSAGTEQQDRRKAIKVLLVEDEAVHQVHQGAPFRRSATESCRDSSVAIMRRRVVAVKRCVQVIARAVLKAVGGVELEVAANGAEAVRRVRERAGAGACYDLILSDHQMPVMDGREVRACVRSCSRKPHRVIVVRAFRPFVRTSS